MDTKKLTQAGREELALALLLLKDFKSQGLFEVETSLYILRFAKDLDVLTEFENLLSKVPPMKVVPR